MQSEQKPQGRVDKYSVKSLVQRGATEEETQTVMKKREDFAISLRKKKHSEMIETKRRANIQKSFQRTVLAQSGADAEFMSITDEYTLNQCIAYLGAPTSERLLILRGIRILTMSKSLDYKLQEILISSDELLGRLVMLLSEENPDFQPSFAEKSECLWILTNLACEGTVCFKMLTQYQFYGLIQNIFTAHFVRPQETKPEPLEAPELAFLEQLLWLTTNLIADTDKSHVDAFGYQIEKLLAIVLHNFSGQFGPELWSLFTWCFNVLSQGLMFLQQANYEIFNMYLVMHYQTITELIMADPKVEEAEKQSLRSDIMRIAFNCIKDAPDEEINFIVNQPHLQQLALDLLKEFSMRNVEMCIRFLGNLFAVNEEICTQYVRNKGILDILKKVFTYCTKQTRKEALWLVSNIAANSEADSLAL